MHHASALTQNFLNVAHGFDVNHHELAHYAKKLIFTSNQKKGIAWKPKMRDAT